MVLQFDLFNQLRSSFSWVYFLSKQDLKAFITFFYIFEYFIEPLGMIQWTCSSDQIFRIRKLLNYLEKHLGCANESN